MRNGFYANVKARGHFDVYVCACVGMCVCVVNFNVLGFFEILDLHVRLDISCVYICKLFKYTKTIWS